VVARAGAVRAFLISGFLLALPGGLLPLWGYYVHPEFGTAGNYFLALGAGMAASMALARKLVVRCRAEPLLVTGCCAATLALLMLTIAAPPAQVWYQTLCCFMTGAAAGLINGAVLESIGPAWEANPAGVTLQGGIYFGAGSIAASLLMAQCIGGDAVGDTSATRLLAIGALLPAGAAIAFSRSRVTATITPAAETGVAANDAAMRDRRTVLAVLFGFLLFFQFANEWSIAGWLPVYLIDRLGISPAGAVMLLALYWMALTLGRIGAAALVRVMPHGRLLSISAFCALFGGTALAASDTRGGVVIGILLMGVGFSAIVPLASERIATRFTSYHPGYFSKLFGFTTSGGIFMAFVLGHLADVAGLRVIPLAAMLGSCAVIALILVIRLGRKVSGN
jgi:FHS family glucose/mannose:H+ symporter-like MFS transporter